MKRTINAIAVFTALCVVLTTSCFAADSSTLHNSDSSQYIVTNFCIDGAERECIAEITSTPSTEPGVIAHRVSYYIPTTDDQQIETDRIVLLIVLLPLGFTELTVAIWGAPSFLGSLAKIAGTSGTRILFLVFTGMLFGRLTLFIHGLPLTKTQ